MKLISVWMMMTSRIFKGSWTLLECFCPDWLTTCSASIAQCSTFMYSITLYFTLVDIAVHWWETNWNSGGLSLLQGQGWKNKRGTSMKKSHDAACEELHHVPPREPISALHCIYSTKRAPMRALYHVLSTIGAFKRALLPYLHVGSSYWSCPIVVEILSLLSGLKDKFSLPLLMLWLLKSAFLWFLHRFHVNTGLKCTPFPHDSSWYVRACCLPGDSWNFWKQGLKFVLAKWVNMPEKGLTHRWCKYIRRRPDYDSGCGQT